MARHRWTGLAAAAALAVLVAAFDIPAWWQQQFHLISNDRPSLAVLPFANSVATRNATASLMG
ncbi:hypothetical protein J2Z31_001756 [Sinorhizobium kostiense]|uniref:Transmembrane protein n=1 Tax=Sinorhizobium kostiense TaxID=76747 RepID=A0ABS4QXQ3_9HYPH|nr:hypothetical protein [Sinorhizobium kostiense]MBP2235264.1 hypothetical protein [Sinorhizobium kostiense]